MTGSVKAIASTLLEQSASSDADEDIDPSVHCSRCTGLCCRLTVVLGPQDDAVPRALTEQTPAGHTVMAHRADGFCVALGADGRSCTIYELRPQDCRRFVMGASYCRAVREDAARSAAL